MTDLIRARTAVGEPERVVIDLVGLSGAAGLERLDRLVRRSTQMLNIPVVLVTLGTDPEPMVLSSTGLAKDVVERRGAGIARWLSHHVMVSGTPLVSEDVRYARRWSSTLTGPDLDVVAIAGIPLRAPQGELLGCFCAIGTQPRPWSAQDVLALQILADAAATEIALLLSDRHPPRVRAR